MATSIDNSCCFMIGCWAEKLMHTLEKPTTHHNKPIFLAVTAHNGWCVCVVCSPQTYFILCWFGLVRCAVRRLQYPHTHTQSYIHTKWVCFVFCAHNIWAAAAAFMYLEWGKWRTFSYRSFVWYMCVGHGEWIYCRGNIKCHVVGCVYIWIKAVARHHKSVVERMRAPVWVCARSVCRHFQTKNETSVCLNWPCVYMRQIFYFKLEKYSTASIVEWFHSIEFASPILHGRSAAHVCFIDFIYFININMHNAQSLKCAAQFALDAFACCP